MWVAEKKDNFQGLLSSKIYPERENELYSHNQTALHEFFGKCICHRSGFFTLDGGDLEEPIMVRLALSKPEHLLCSHAIPSKL